MQTSAAAPRDRAGDLGSAARSDALWFGVLGPVQVRRGEQDLTPSAPKLRALLTLLLLRSDEVVPVPALIDALWVDPPRTVTTSLQLHICKLRRLLDAEPADTSTRLRTHPGGYRLVVAGDALDLRCFRALARRGRRLRAAGEVARAADVFREALALWRGPALGGAQADTLTHVYAPALDEERLAVVQERIECDLASGRHGELIGELRALTQAHPLREHLTAALMTALYRCGRQADALDAYERLRRRLLDGLGLTPSPDLTRLQLAILRHDDGLDRLRSAARPAASPPPASRGRATRLSSA